MDGITFAGSLIVDVIKEIDTLPARSELAKVRRIEHSTGGLVCNTGIDFKTLDPTVRVQAAGVIGEDADGDRILEVLGKHGIDTSRILRRGVTSFTDVYAEPTARTFFQYGGASDTFDIDDIAVNRLNCRIFHIGYLLLLNRLDSADERFGTRMARLLAHVREAGIETSIDVVSENSERFAEVIPPALPYTNYLIFNEFEAGRTAGIPLRGPDGRLLESAIPQVLERLLGMGVRTWAVIHCPEGAWGMDRAGHFVKEPSHPLPKGWIRGTVGAGDAFCAGVLLGAYRGLPLADALVYGNASAQVSLRSPTATGSMTSIEEALRIYRA